MERLVRSLEFFKKQSKENLDAIFLTEVIQYSYDSLKSLSLTRIVPSEYLSTDSFQGIDAAFPQAAPSIMDRSLVEAFDLDTKVQGAKELIFKYDSLYESFRKGDKDMFNRLFAEYYLVELGHVLDLLLFISKDQSVYKAEPPTAIDFTCQRTILDLKDSLLDVIARKVSALFELYHKFKFDGFVSAVRKMLKLLLRMCSGFGFDLEKIETLYRLKEELGGLLDAEIRTTVLVGSCLILRNYARTYEATNQDTITNTIRLSLRNLENSTPTLLPEEQNSDFLYFFILLKYFDTKDMPNPNAGDRMLALFDVESFMTEFKLIRESDKFCSSLVHREFLADLLVSVERMGPHGMRTSLFLSFVISCFPNPKEVPEFTRALTETGFLRKFFDNFLTGRSDEFMKQTIYFAYNLSTCSKEVSLKVINALKNNNTTGNNLNRIIENFRVDLDRVKNSEAGTSEEEFVKLSTSLAYMESKYLLASSVSFKATGVSDRNISLKLFSNLLKNCTDSIETIFEFSGISDFIGSIKEFLTVDGISPETRHLVFKILRYLALNPEVSPQVWNLFDSLGIIDGPLKEELEGDRRNDPTFSTSMGILKVIRNLAKGGPSPNPQSRRFQGVSRYSEFLIQEILEDRSTQQADGQSRLYLVALETLYYLIKTPFLILKDIENDKTMDANIKEGYVSSITDSVNNAESLITLISNSINVLDMFLEVIAYSIYSDQSDKIIKTVFRIFLLILQIRDSNTSLSESSITFDTLFLSEKSFITFLFNEITTNKSLRRTGMKLFDSICTKTNSLIIYDHLKSHKIPNRIPALIETLFDDLDSFEIFLDVLEKSRSNSYFSLFIYLLGKKKFNRTGHDETLEQINYEKDGVSSLIVVLVNEWQRIQLYRPSLLTKILRVIFYVMNSRSFGEEFYSQTGISEYDLVPILRDVQDNTEDSEYLLKTLLNVMILNHKSGMSEANTQIAISLLGLYGKKSPMTKGNWFFQMVLNHSQLERAWSDVFNSCLLFGISRLDPSTMLTLVSRLVKIILNFLDGHGLHYNLQYQVSRSLYIACYFLDKKLLSKTIFSENNHLDRIIEKRLLNLRSLIFVLKIFEYISTEPLNLTYLGLLLSQISGQINSLEDASDFDDAETMYSSLSIIIKNVGRKVFPVLEQSGMLDILIECPKHFRIQTLLEVCGVDEAKSLVENGLVRVFKKKIAAGEDMSFEGLAILSFRLRGVVNYCMDINQKIFYGLSYVVSLKLEQFQVGLVSGQALEENDMEEVLNILRCMWNFGTLDHPREHDIMWIKESGDELGKRASIQNRDISKKYRTFMSRIFNFLARHGDPNVRHEMFSHEMMKLILLTLLDTKYEPVSELFLVTDVEWRSRDKISVKDLVEYLWKLTGAMENPIHVKDGGGGSTNYRKHQDFYFESSLRSARSLLFPNNITDLIELGVLGVSKILQSIVEYQSRDSDGQLLRTAAGISETSLILNNSISVGTLKNILELMGIVESMASGVFLERHVQYIRKNVERLMERNT